MNITEHKDKKQQKNYFFYLPDIPQIRHIANSDIHVQTFALQHRPSFFSTPQKAMRNEGPVYIPATTVIPATYDLIRS